MGTLNIVLVSNGDRQIDRDIRVFSPGWEHAGILQADGRVWEALVLDGVQLAQSLMTNHAAPEIVTILDPQLTADQERLVLAFLNSVKGAHYDLTGIAGVPFWQNWSQKGEYFCSQLVAAALAAAAAFPLSCADWQVWPCHLGWLAPAVWPVVKSYELAEKTKS